MTPARTFNELFEPTIRLHLHQTPGGTYAVTDQHGRLYTFGQPSLTMCLNFMLRFVEQHDAVIDDASVERVTGADAVEYSVKVDALSERDGTGIGRDSGESYAARTKPKTPAPRSESVPDNVVPIRRGA